MLYQFGSPIVSENIILLSHQPNKAADLANWVGFDCACQFGSQKCNEGNLKKITRCGLPKALTIDL